MSTSFNNSKITLVPYLKGCPFCGVEPSIKLIFNNLAGSGRAYISCCVEMEECFIQNSYHSKKIDSEDFAKSELTKKWNKRAK